MGKRQEAIEAGNLEEPFYAIVAGYRALNEFLWYLNEDSGPKDVHMMDGVLALFESQLEQLDDIRGSVEIKQKILDQYRDQIEELTTAREASPTPVAKKIREEFIATKSKEGVDAGDIAAAMNMKRASIEKVIQQLEGGATKRGRDDTGDRVVNG